MKRVSPMGNEEIAIDANHYPLPTKGISLGMTPEEAIDYADYCCAKSESRYEHYSENVDNSIKPTEPSNRYFIRRT